jgi:hypothetical protein
VCVGCGQERVSLVKRPISDIFHSILAVLCSGFPSKVYELGNLEAFCLHISLQLCNFCFCLRTVPIAPDFLKVRSICRFIHKRCHADAMVLETMATATGIHTILTAMSTKVEWRELSVKHCSFYNADFIQNRIGWKCRYHLRRETATTI